MASLYFWALQASFHDGAATHGAGHLGLQWCPDGAPGRSVNWGGYDAGGAVLAGSGSALPSRTSNPNTRDYPWQELRPYRLRIHRSPGRPGAWRGEVVDLAAGGVGGAGKSTVVRDLFVPAPYLSEVVTWSEVFADCDAPPVAVRWSRMVALTAHGTRVPARAVTVGYQSGEEGGCDNTTAVAEGSGVLQLTNSPRTVPAGARLMLA